MIFLSFALTDYEKSWQKRDERERERETHGDIGAPEALTFVAML